ncbi:MAG: tRNA 2-thiouridine(34) synthase MnmA [Candidatus Paceibacterota bacterium]
MIKSQVKKIPTKHRKQGRNVFVGLSGGVDSSVAAYLLKKEGFNVTGVFIKVWHPDFLKCNWKEEKRDAMRVCAHLDIPFKMLDLEKEYKKDVVDYMIEKYKEGITPNPDVMCNKYVKFGGFYDWALKNGADFIATGHYAIKNEVEGKYQLLASKDKNKDQTYFLWTLTQKQLEKILFPIGHLQKEELRKIAKIAGLSTFDKKDSQGLCFIGKVDMRDFLKKFIKSEKGKVLDKKGNVIGTHEGAYFYTIGQRHGFIISKKNPEEKPLFVISKKIEKNTITVSEEQLPETDIGNRTDVVIENINWISKELINDKSIYSARIRYRQPLHDCKIKKINDKKWIVSFIEPTEPFSPGQSLVVYNNDICLGGGIIC